MEDSVKDFMTKTEMISAKLIEYAMTYGIKILVAIVILFGGFWIANRLAGVAESSLSKKDFDATIRVYLSRILNVAFKVIVVITAAGVLGIETTSFVAVLGAAGLAVGLALQGSLANFAGGVLILVLRPFQVGDYIIAQGEEGVVSAIDVFNTTLLKIDNRTVIIPNGPLIGNVIINSTAQKNRRVDVSVGISYDSNIDKAEAALIKMAMAHPKVLKDPVPFMGIVRFGDSSVDLTFRVWCNTVDYWDVYFDMYKNTKSVFDKEGISIPFPRRDMHIIHSNVKGNPFE